MITFTRVQLSTASEEYTSSLSLQLNTLNALEAEESTYLSDLITFGEGDLLTENRDFLVRSGLLNYGQAVTHRLMTTRGSHPIDPTIGINWYNYMGQTYISPEFIQATLSLEISQEIYKDFRTSNVYSVIVEFSDINTVLITASFSALSPEVLELTLTAKVG